MRRSVQLPQGSLPGRRRSRRSLLRKEVSYKPYFLVTVVSEKCRLEGRGAPFTAMGPRVYNSRVTVVSWGRLVGGKMLRI